MARLALLLCAAALSLLPVPAGAHGDATIPLYVADDGTDRGGCDDPVSPCASIAYALEQAAKGTQVRVASGRYAVAGSEDLFLLVSGVVDVVGGFDRKSGFARREDGGASILTGVPATYRQSLAGRGFHVIADTKADAGPIAESTGKLLALHGKLQSGVAAAPCVNGSAGSLPCDDVDLLAHVPIGSISEAPASGNDIWGFVDLNSGREYVLAGFNIGTVVLDVTDPQNPREVGFVDGQNAGWRDIKVFQRYDAASERFNAYAYVTTDGSSDGLFVIDLGGLPHAVSRVPYPSQFFAAHNVYSTSTDFATGLPLSAAPHLIVAGSNLGVGQYRAYSLADPRSPAFVAGSDVGPSLPGNDPTYMHDAASLIVTDSRIASCPNAVTHCELLLDFNEQKLEVWDITNISDPRHMNPGSAQYPQRGYVHSGWWSEDRRYAFVHDELDEQGFNIPTRVRVFSLADLSNPQLVGQWDGPTRAIDHNGFVRGNRYYMSNYSRGLTVLDISNPVSPVAVGRLDTYPVSDGSGFFGAWGAYPFLPSGTLAISDMNSGVYLAADRSTDVAQGRLGFAAASAGVQEGQSLQLAVSRTGGSSGAVDVDVEIVHATTDAADVTLSRQTLAWSDGETGAKFIDVAAAADADDESLELLILRLVDPSGGATLTDINVLSLHVAEPGDANTVRLLDRSIEIAERGFATAVVVVQRTGSSAGPVSVDYALVAGSADPASDFSGPAAGTLSWADGDAMPRTIEYTITDDGQAESDESFGLQLANPNGAAIDGPDTLEVTIVDGAGPNRAPNALVPTANLIAVEGSTVTMDGSGSNDPDGDVLSFAWVQSQGPAVTLSNPTGAVTTFTAPQVDSDSLLVFQLTVSDPAGLSDTAIVPVALLNGTNAGSGGGGGGGGAATLLWLLALASLVGRRIRRRA